MEWDKIWALNRKNIDKFCLWYTAISKENNAEINVIDTDD